ncbi:MAG: ATPase [Bradyrhizobium sp.]|nr:MAG: ATPase [Bradyrhizobium sp.]
MSESKFIYVTYIRTTPEKLWAALTQEEFIKQYWFGVAFDTDWKPGSPWRMHYADGQVTDEGEVAQCEPPRRLALRWRHKMRPQLAEEGEAFCLIELEPHQDTVKLTVTHTMPQPDSKLIQAVSGGWPSILSNLKSLLETGKVILTRM